jgi:DUF2950 family protein
MKTAYPRATIAIFTALILFTSASAPAAEPKVKAYASPQAAVDDFVGALRNYDLKALLAIFGNEAQRIFASEDPVADENLRKQFLALYDQKHELQSKGESTRIVLTGDDGWPMPIPLVKSTAGWTFDTAAGIEEIINRRIGRNELSAIQTCLAVGDAQREYFREDHDGDGILEYAQTLRSAPGLQDGLYWPAVTGESLSPLGEFVATAAEEGYGPGDSAYHGYRYRLLTRQGPAAPGGAYDYMVRGNQIGGFAVVAYPAAYGDSGIMTFLLSHAGVVYQKDLGEHTESKALNMESFNPEGWTKVDKKDLAIIPEQ